MQIKTMKSCLNYIFEARLTPMIVGAHGIGKSQAVKQVADEQGLQFIDIRLGNMQPGDFLGLADFAKDENGVNVATRFMRPDWLPTDRDSKGIIFLDELNRANREVLQGVFQLILDKKIHTYELPKGWNVVAAMNPDTNDYTTTDVTDKALVDRFVWLKLTPSVSEWLEYAVDTKSENVLTAFIREQDKLLDGPTQDFNLDMVQPSRRSWKDGVDRILKLNPPEDILREIVYGLVGTTAGTAFLSFMTNYDSAIKADDILHNFSKVKSKIKKYADPDNARIDLLNNTCDEIIAIPALREKLLTEDECSNLLSFMMTIPRDLSYNFLQKFILKVNPDCPNFIKIIGSDKKLIDAVKKSRAEFAKTEQKSA